MNIEIPLDIQEVELTKYEINSDNEILLYVESEIKKTVCRVCRKEIDKFHGYDREIKIRHLDILGMTTYICINPARYICTHCDNNTTTTQKLTWYEKRSHQTKAYEAHILIQLVNSTIHDVSIKEEIGYRSIEGILLRNIENEINFDTIKELPIIGLDEISLKKGHKDFVTIITAIIHGKIKVLAVLKGRKKQTIKDFFLKIPKKIRKTVQSVCCDMYQGYVNAAKEVFGNKVIVIDRFHVAKLYRKCIDNIRKKELQRLKNELSKEDYQKLKGVMWILRKNQEELNEKELEVLNYLFELSNKIQEVYILCNKLTNIFEKNITREEACIEINKWIDEVEETKLNYFNTFIKSLKKYFEGILNYFINRVTSGFVEGFNNKIKVIKRRCYGIFNRGHLFQRIHLDLEGYDVLL